MYSYSLIFLILLILILLQYSKLYELFINPYNLGGGYLITRNKYNYKHRNINS